MNKRPGNVLSIYLGEEIKEKWLRFCASNGTTSSEAMRAVVRKLTGESPTPQVYESIHEQPDPGRKRIEIRLTASEFECVRQLAQNQGNSPNAWIVNLVRANLTREPQLGFHELQTLGKSNSNLLAIGRNLNQIARWMNGNGGRAPLELERVEQLYRLIVAHTEVVTTVMRANIDRWTLK